MIGAEEQGQDPDPDQNFEFNDQCCEAGQDPDPN